MIRENRVFGPLSQAQLVWGDAVFFLGRSAFLTRLARQSAQERELTMTRFVVILACHRAHDFAVEVLQAAAAADLVPASLATALERVVRQSATCSAGLVGRLLVGAALASGFYVISLPFASLRLPAKYYFKRRTGAVWYLLWRATARGGELNASVSDTVI